MDHIRYVMSNGAMSPGGLQHLTPHYTDMAQITRMRDETYEIALEEMKKSGAKHGVYAVYKYNDNGDVSDVNYYLPPVLFDDDDEFYSRVEAAEMSYGKCLILCVHRHE